MNKSTNQINVIYPYRTTYGWSFDDSDVGLQGEPFVAGIPQVIDSLVGDADKFTALISKDPLPDYTCRLIKIPEDMEGWYQLEGTDMKGWLCPATLKYFENYPDNIYVKIEI